MIINLSGFAEELDSYHIKFSLRDPILGTSIIPSDVKVYIFLKGGTTSPVYINGRDGTKSSGMTWGGGSNSVRLDMLPADNSIIGNYPNTSGYEYHVVRFNVKYNSGVDNFTLEFILKVRNLVLRP